jgi:hypothetical protein
MAMFFSLHEINGPVSDRRNEQAHYNMIRQPAQGFHIVLKDENVFDTIACYNKLM